MLEREIRKSILADFKRKKVIVLLGARQVGKKNYCCHWRFFV